MAFWNNNECLTRSELEKIQLERLKWQVKYAYENVPFYKNKWDEIGLKPEHIQTLKDIQKIPFTVKDDLRQNYPDKMFAVDNSEIVRIHGSSGTTGKPIIVGYTRNDMENWTECCARMATAAGVTNKDTAQISFGYGLFTGGFGLHYGLERVGATVIPVSSGNTERQIMFLQDLKSTVLVATPSYVLRIAEVLGEMGLTKDDIFLRVGMFGGEGHTTEMREQIEASLGIFDTQNYGLTELCGPGLSYECLEHTGMHINEDFFIAEIINPETGEVLPEGSEGELVLSTLTKEGIPMLRYRTKDITKLHYEQCSCGRTNARMELVKGRSDDMMVIRGVNVFPSQIESVLMNIEGIGQQYQLIVTTEKFTDRMEVQVELADGSMIESYANLEKLTNEIRYKLKTTLLIDTKVTLLNPKTLERTAGKSKRVIDKRNKAF